MMHVLQVSAINQQSQCREIDHV